MIIKMIYTVILALAFLTLPAQEENGAFAGGNGIFVFLHDGLYSKSGPDNGLTAISIERKAANEREWKEIATVSSPQSEKEFSSRLKKTLDEMPYEVSILREKADAIWTSVNAWNKDPESGGYLIYLPVQIAAGLAYLDRSAEAGLVYTYRIIKRDAAGTDMGQLEFHPVSYPKTLTGLSFAYKDHSSEGSGMVLEFSGPEEQFPSVVQLYRKDELTDEFQPVDARYSIQSDGGNSLVTVLDEKAEPRKLYQYELRPMDQFGNSGPAEASPVIGHYNFQQHAPVLMQLRTLKSPNGVGTQLQWEYGNYDLAAAVRVMRSEDIDGPYEAIAELPRNANSYIDQTIRPMNGFYYQLQVLGPLGEAAAPGTPVRAYFEDPVNQVPPVIRSVTTDADGIDLEIEIKDLHIEGVRIYRSTSADKEMTLVSGLVPALDDVILWKDDKLGEDGQTFYYTATAVSTSHVASTFSDTLRVEWRGSKVDAMLQHAPGNLEAKDNGSSVTLYWDDVYAEVDHVRYVVLRKAAGEANFTNITPEFLAFSNYTDRAADPKTSYEYSVAAIYDKGVTSELSPAVRVERREALPLSPSGIKVLQTGEGIQLEWNEVADPNVAAYQVYRYQRGEAPLMIARIAAGQVLRYLDRNVQKGQLYFYFVRSAGVSGILGNPSGDSGIRLK